jgi:hypothetical protein
MKHTYTHADAIYPRMRICAYARAYADEDAYARCTSYAYAYAIYPRMRICARVSLRVYVAVFFDWDDFSVRVRVVG